jgi:hypothetical protein
MYFGESAELELINEESLRMKQFFSSEVLEDIDPEDMKPEDIKRILGRLNKEQNKKKLLYKIKTCLGFLLSGAIVGTVAAVSPLAAIPSAVMVLINGIRHIIEKENFAETDYGYIATRIDKKITQLEDAGVDKKIIEAHTKLHATIMDLETDARVNSASGICSIFSAINLAPKNKIKVPPSPNKQKVTKHTLNILCVPLLSPTALLSATNFEIAFGTPIEDRVKRSAYI